MRVLGAVARAADGAVDDPAVHERLARAIVGSLADGCLLDVRTSGGRDEAVDAGDAAPAPPSHRRIAVHVDPALAARLQRFFPPDVPETPVARAIATGRSLAWFDAADAPQAVGAAVAALGARSLLVVPATSRGGTTAVLTLVAGAGRPPFDAFDLALARDVAARVALAADHARSYRLLGDAVRARDDLMAAVSHDLRDPLSAIAAGTSVLRRIAPGDGGVARAIDLVARNADRMLQLVRNLLDLARNDSAGMRLEPGTHPLRAIVYDALDTIGPVAAEKGLQLEARMPADLPLVRCDREATARVLRNLVSNAVKFTPPGGAIRVRVEPIGSEVRIAVSDTGTGIAREDVGHVFDRYWQSARAPRTGAGLGLSIAKAIVEQSGGSIWLESHVGVGTTFTFTVPVA